MVEGRQQSADLSGELKRREQELEAEQGEQQRELAEARRRLEQIREELAAARDKRPVVQTPVEVPPVDVTGHKQRSEQLQAELEMQREKIAQLEKEISERKLPPEESEVTILPAGSGAAFESFFVEYAAGKLPVIGKGRIDLPHFRRSRSL